MTRFCSFLRFVKADSGRIRVHHCYPGWRGLWEGIYRDEIDWGFVFDDTHPDVGYRHMFLPSINYEHYDLRCRTVRSC